MDEDLSMETPGWGAQSRWRVREFQGCTRILGHRPTPGSSLPRRADSGYQRTRIPFGIWLAQTHGGWQRQLLRPDAHPFT
jgi:hypothetical protein